MEQIQANAIRERYLLVLERIKQAAQASGRNPATVRLVVVTKTHPLETIRAVVEAGARDLGENYAEEGAAKIEALSSVNNLCWHMIGHIQSRKTNLVVSHFNFFHALDSLKLAVRLDGLAKERGCRLPVLLEVNVSGEDSKLGYPAWDTAKWDALRPEFEQIVSLPNLEVRGLMTMPPFVVNPEASRPFFRQMCVLQAYLNKSLPKVAWDDLSMGTSADFSVAVEEGATIVRVGTTIFGSRKLQE